MKLKQAFIILAVVAAVIAGIAAYEMVLVPKQKEKQKQESLFFPDLDPEQATRMSIISGDTTVILARKDGGEWKVETSGGYPADTDAVSGALDLLKELKRANPSSTSKANHSRLGVDEKGIRVQVKAVDKAVVDLVVGKQGENYGTTFARRADSDAVYLVYENLNNPFDTKPGAWRDKSIFDMSIEDVLKMTLTTWPGAAEGDTVFDPEGEPEVMVIEREKELGDWMLTAPGDTAEKLDKSKTDAAVRNLCTIRASEFADHASPEEAGLDPPRRKAELLLKSGDAFTLLVGKKDDSRYYVKRTDRDVVQKVYQYNVNNIFKDKESLLPLPDEKVEPEFDIGELLPAPQLDVPGK